MSNKDTNDSLRAGSLHEPQSSHSAYQLAHQPTHETGAVEATPDSAQDVEKQASEGSLTEQHQQKKDVVIYKTWEKWLIVVLAAVSGIWSSISSPIYLPVIPIMKHEFHTTTEMINLTVTIYSVFQGISPMFWAALSDNFGRRSIFIVCLLIYSGANIGLALCQNYWTLFGLRMLQAFGIASTIAISAATTADLTTRSNRGTFVGVSNGVSLIGNCFGPLIGGGIAAGLGWRAIFYFLLIGSSVVLVLLIILLPETNHDLVGDGSIYPKSIATISPYIIWRSKKYGSPSKDNISRYSSAAQADSTWGTCKNTCHKLYIRMKSCIMMLFELDVALVLIPTSLHYTSWLMGQTALSSLLSTNYHFDVDQIGCSYLASGAGALLGSFTVGKTLSLRYAAIVKKYQRKLVEQGKPVDMSKFNIQQARTELLPIFSLILCSSTLIFGWTIQYHVHYVVPIIMTFFTSLSSIAFLTGTVTLVIDLFPGESASANACLNLCRCLICAVGLAVLDKMLTHIKAGWTFTIVTLLCLVSNAGLLMVAKIGPRIEKRRRDKLIASERAKESSQQAETVP